jgi:hypothetical protein
LTNFLSFVKKRKEEVRNPSLLYIIKPHTGKILLLKKLYKNGKFYGQENLFLKLNLTIYFRENKIFDPSPLLRGFQSSQLFYCALYSICIESIAVKLLTFFIINDELSNPENAYWTNGVDTLATFTKKK